MRQVGLLPGSNLFGDEVPPKTPDRYKTALGKLKATPRKAISWYAEEHQLNLMATSVWPWITFKQADGSEKPVHIDEIIGDYEVHRINSKRRRQAS